MSIISTYNKIIHNVSLIPNKKKRFCLQFQHYIQLRNNKDKKSSETKERPPMLAPKKFVNLPEVENAAISRA